METWHRENSRCAALTHEIQDRESQDRNKFEFSVN